MRIKAAVVAAIMAVVGVATQAPALAGEYSGCLLTVTPSQVTHGNNVTVAGTGLEPNFNVDVFIDDVGSASKKSVLVNVTTDATGSFSQSVTITTAIKQGSHKVTVACDSSGEDVSETTLKVNNKPKTNSAQNNSAVVLGTSITQGGSSTGTAATAAATSALPRTGDDIEPLLMAAALALVAGSGFVVAARRRRHASSAV